jgi:ABC-2 type transport system permease protein
MKRYLAVLRGSFMVSVVYRFGFLFTIIGNIVYLSVAYFLWKSIYRYSDVIRGMTFNETFLYIGLGSAVFILLKTYVDWFLSFEIREGSIASYLIKPIDFGTYYLCISLGSVLMNLLAITLPTLVMMLFVFKVKFTLGPGLILLPLSLFMAFIISFCFDYFIGLLGFYSESIWGLSTVKEIVVTFFSGALIPLQFFPAAMQKVLLWLPFQAVYHTPLMMVTRPDQNWGVSLNMLLVQFTWTVVLFVAVRMFYGKAIKVLRVSGG